MKYFSPVSFALLLLLTPVAMAEKNLDAGKKLFNQFCEECHGEGGNNLKKSSSKIPSIAGFSSFSILESLAQFVEKSRPALEIISNNNKKKTMYMISKKITQEQSEEIAYYLSKQKFIAVTQKIITEEMNDAYETGESVHQDLCESCHGDKGTSVEDDTPILKGQRKEYLERQFEQFTKYQRTMPRRMKRKFNKLSEAEKQAVIVFYTRSKTANK